MTNPLEVALKNKMVYRDLIRGSRLSVCFVKYPDTRAQGKIAAAYETKYPAVHIVPNTTRISALVNGPKHACFHISYF